MEFSFSALRFILQTNFAPVVSVFVLIAFIKTNVTFSDKINLCFIFICLAVLSLTIADNMRFFTSQLPHPTIYRYIAVGCGYVLRPTIVFLLTMLASRYKRKTNLFFAIPLLLCSTISIISIFPFSKGIMFSFTEDNHIIRGPFGFFSQFLAIFYSIQTIYYSFKNTKNNRIEPFVLIVIEIAALIAFIMEHSFDYDFVLSQVLISSIVFYYFFLLTQTYKRDTLTNLLNRRCFYLQINHLLKREMTLLSMDMNNLKILNDTHGHAAGDKALITVSQEMMKSFSKYAKIYRTGGDEFMGIFKKADMPFIEKLVNNFQEALKKTDYRVACGIAKYTPEDDIEKIISLSDERMYSNKVKIKNEESFTKI